MPPCPASPYLVGGAYRAGEPVSTSLSPRCSGFRNKNELLVTISITGGRMCPQESAPCHRQVRLSLLSPSSTIQELRAIREELSNPLADRVTGLAARDIPLFAVSRLTFGMDRQSERV